MEEEGIAKSAVFDVEAGNARVSRWIKMIDRSQKNGWIVATSDVSNVKASRLGIITGHVHRLRSGDGRDRRVHRPRGRRSEQPQNLAGRPSPWPTLRPPSGDAKPSTASGAGCAANPKHGRRVSTGQSDGHVKSAGHADGVVQRSTS